MNTQRKGTRRTWLLLGLILVAGVLLAAGLYPFWLWEFFDPDLAGQPKRPKVSSTRAPSSSLGGWPQWRGPNRDGISADKGFRTDWPEDGPGPLLAWEKPIGRGYSSVAIADGRLFTMFGDGKKETILCLDAATGDELWRLTYRCVHAVEYGPGPRSTPSVDGDRVYTVGITGLMHCLKAASGEIVWERDLLSDFGAPNLRWGVSFSPLVVGDLVYTNPGKSDGKSLAALNKYNGEVKWSNLEDPAGYSSPIFARPGGKDQIIFFTGRGLVGVAPDSGQLFWRYDLTNRHEANAATPIVVGNHVYASTSYDGGCVLAEIRPADGGGLEAHKVYAHTRMQEHFPSSVYFEGNLYGFHNQVLQCIEFLPREGKTPKVFWKESNFGRGSLLLADGHLIILSDDGYLALAEASPIEFKKKAGFRVLGGTCWTVPVLVEGRLFLRNEEKIMCLDLRK